jgi:hypothetical protein
VHDGLDARLARRVRLARDVALHRDLLVGEKGGDVEGVGPDLLVGEAELRFEPLPVGLPPRGGDEDRLALEMGQRVALPTPGCESRMRGSFWKYAATATPGSDSLTKFSWRKPSNSQKSTPPARKIVLVLSCGPPFRMSTSRPASR